MLSTACASYQFQGAVIDPPARAPEIEMHDQFGGPFILGEQTGKVNLIFFGYTHCPDVCPSTLADFKYIHSGLGEAAAKVNFIFISVDPARDTPEHLTSYLAGFDPAIIGLTGTDAQFEQVVNGYGVYAEFQEPDEAGEYLVDHTARIFVVDGMGNLRLTFPFGVNRDAMLDDINRLIMEL
jgi:protein SCO1/2